jgi:hypothetical protein
MLGLREHQMLNDYSLYFRVIAFVECAASAVYRDSLLNKSCLLWLLALQWSFKLLVLCDCVGFI